MREWRAEGGRQKVEGIGQGGGGGWRGRGVGLKVNPAKCKDIQLKRSASEIITDSTTYAKLEKFLRSSGIFFNLELTRSYSDRGEVNSIWYIFQCRTLKRSISSSPLPLSCPLLTLRLRSLAPLPLLTPALLSSRPLASAPTSALRPLLCYPLLFFFTTNASLPEECKYCGDIPPGQNPGFVRAEILGVSAPWELELDFLPWLSKSWKFGPLPPFPPSCSTPSLSWPNILLGWLTP
jgi:hypothetical protein